MAAAIMKFPLSFYEIRLLRVGPDNKRAFADRIEYGRASLQHFGGATGDDDKLARCRRFGAAEDRCRTVLLAALAMHLRKPRRQFHADGAHRDMHRAGGHGIENPLLIEQQVQQRAVVGNHGDNHVRFLRGFGRRAGNAFDRSQRFRLGPRAVEHPNAVPGID